MRLVGADDNPPFPDRPRGVWTQLRLTGASAGSTILRIRSGCAVPPVPLRLQWRWGMEAVAKCNNLSKTLRNVLIFTG